MDQTKTFYHFTRLFFIPFMTRSFALLTILLIIPGMLFSQQSESDGEMYAIVVGISKYNYIKPLHYADRDADLFASLLRSAAGGRIKEENLFLLKNDSANAGNFWSTLLRVSNKNLKKGDRVYIFFAGHGDGVKGLNEYYLLLSDCQASNDGNNYLLSFGVINMYHLKNRIGVLINKGAEVILVLDACRTNELAGGYASQVFSSSIIQTKVGEIAMLATSPGQISIEDASFGQGHGLFTYNLVDALSGRADNEGNGNKDKKITLGEIQNWVSKNVNQMSAKFNVKQDPVFCCDDQGNTTIGLVDSSFNLVWNQLKLLNNTSAIADNTQRSSSIPADSTLLSLYNKFNSARNKNNLWGNGSADDYYDQMKTKYPEEKLTEDARYALASSFINFAQQKINLYLEGVDVLSVEILREKSDSINRDEFISEEYERIKKTVSEKWTIAGMMLQKAGKLLSTKQDSSILLQMRPKINFLLARGYLSYEKENLLNYDEALKIANDAYKADSSAAYTAECLGLLYAYRLSFQYRYKNNDIEFDFGSSKPADTSLYFFRKATRLAPNWISPYRSIALKVYGWYSVDSALLYLQKAITINPRNPSTYLITADFLHPFRRGYDSVLYYYKTALALSPQSAYPDIYSKIGRAFSRLQQGKSYRITLVKDSVLWYSHKALSLDKTNINAYKNLSSLYERENKIDSVLFIYRQARSAMPKDPNPYYWLIRAYSYLQKKPDSVFYYSKQLLGFDPENPVALFQVAKYYDDKNVADSAILYYERSINTDYILDWTYERLGYLTMQKNKSDTMVLHYFLKVLQSKVPGGWRAYYNITCYYSNQENLDKAIEFLEKTLAKGMRNYKQLYSDPYLAYIRDKEPFHRLIKKYFPDNK